MSKRYAPYASTPSAKHTKLVHKSSMTLDDSVRFYKPSENIAESRSTTMKPKSEIIKECLHTIARDIAVIGIDYFSHTCVTKKFIEETTEFKKPGVEYMGDFILKMMIDSIDFVVNVGKSITNGIDGMPQTSICCKTLQFFGASSIYFNTNELLSLESQSALILMCQPGLAMFHSTKNINNGSNLSSMSGFLYNKTFNVIFPRKTVVLGIIKHLMLAFKQIGYQNTGCTFVLELLDYMSKEIFKAKSNKIHFPDHMKSQEEALRDQMMQMIVDGTRWIKEQICINTNYFHNRKFSFLCPFLDVGVAHSENGLDDNENKCLKIVNSDTMKFCAEALYCNSDMSESMYFKTLSKYQQWMHPVKK